jgi:hypothetical protein
MVLDAMSFSECPKVTLQKQILSLVGESWLSTGRAFAGNDSLDLNQHPFRR